MKLLAVAALAAASLASVADAATVRITGSTAFRKAMNNAIKNVFDASPSASSYTYAYSGTDFNAASQVIFVGDLGSGPVTVKTSMAGSMAGVYSVAKNTRPTALNVKYIPDATVGSHAGTASTAGTVSEVADIAFSDIAQESTIAIGSGYDTVQQDKVGVIVFKWLLTQVDPAAGWASDINGIGNVTPWAVQQILGSGVPATFLNSAAVASNSTYVYATGRDEDSGTRIVAFAESAFGPFNAPLQYSATVTGGLITNIAPYAVNTTVNTAFGNPPGWAVVGHSGENSGGTLAGKMVKVSSSVTRTAQNGATAAKKLGLLTYAGLSDAATAIGNGAKELAWNGVMYSDAAVKNGSYTFWGYEWMMHRQDANSDTLSVYDLLLPEVSSPAVADLSGTDLNSMNVSRGKEGDIVSPL